VADPEEGGKSEEGRRFTLKKAQNQSHKMTSSDLIAEIRELPESFDAFRPKKHTLRNGQKSIFSAYLRPEYPPVAESVHRIAPKQ
jgi:hypothetical protein